MRWMRWLFGAQPHTPSPIDPLPEWKSHRGDEWWCGEAEASYGDGRFVISSFGEGGGSTYALLLLRSARQLLPNALLDIWLDGETRPLVEELCNRKQIEVAEIEIGDKSRVARILRII